MAESGLILVATPIGNARDITLRGVEALRDADVLVAEDTRSLRRLMDLHGISVSGRRLIAYHDHSTERERAQILAALEAGKRVVYASEAGTPLIADPGYALVDSARTAGFRVTTAPGVSAVVTALSIAGLPTDRFFFAGFLPSAKSARKAAIRSLTAVPGTLVFYESPRRLAASLADMAELLGAERGAAVCRELTKKFEEVRRGSLAELSAGYREERVKGEIVVLVEAAVEQAASEQDLREALLNALDRMSMKDAVREVSETLRAPRRDVYQLALEMLGKH
jgi:16S rRNA (cytidine1402-2'-O)-methyltransferase